MNQDHQNQPDQTEEKELEKLFKIIGSRPALPEHLKTKWSELFRNELDNSIRKRRQKLLAIGSVCASVLLLTLSAAVFITQEVSPQLYIAELTSFKGNVSLDEYSLSNQSNTHKIKPGTFIETEDDSYARITYLTKDLRLNKNTLIQLFNDKLILLAGNIYISTNKGTGILVIAGSTEIRDIGTQFMVSKNALGVLTQVRDGAVTVKVATDEYLINADASAKRLEVFQNDKVQVSDINTFGVEWGWILNLSPSFNIEGKSVYDFLTWSSHETGRELLFTDDRAEQVAKNTILHGNISATNPEQVAHIVLATTHLLARQTHSGQLEISLP